MDHFKIYTQQDVLSIVNKRAGEEKLGEKVQFYPSDENIEISLAGLKNCSAKFVLLGIPEDIGVRANHGIGGTKTAWTSTLKSLLNIQSNSFLVGDELLLLGHFEIKEPDDQSIAALRNKVTEIDGLVYPVIEQIIDSGKIPVVIGGGHNNAFPIIWGVAKALKQAINVVNIDAHTDLRSPKEGRHSGNGFSMALQEGFLNQYFIFGLHQNYTNKALVDYIKDQEKLDAFYLEDLLQSDQSMVANWKIFTSAVAAPCGLEIDLDSIAGLLASAESPSGFALNDIRKILLAGRPFKYLHICEGATQLSDGRTGATTGKAIAYLISDFIKALLPRIYPQP